MVGLLETTFTLSRSSEAPPFKFLRGRSPHKVFCLNQERLSLGHKPLIFYAFTWLASQGGCIMLYLAGFRYFGQRTTVRPHLFFLYLSISLITFRVPSVAFTALLFLPFLPRINSRLTRTCQNAFLYSTLFSHFVLVQTRPRNRTRRRSTTFDLLSWDLWNLWSKLFHCCDRLPHRFDPHFLSHLLWNDGLMSDWSRSSYVYTDSSIPHYETRFTIFHSHSSRIHGIDSQNALAAWIRFDLSRTG